MLEKITLLLIVVGALNWGLNVFDFNLVAFLSLGVTMVENAVYVLVAASGLYQAKNII